MNQIKVLIVDDHQVVRSGISSLLDDEVDIEIVGEASNGLEAIDKIKLHNPDIALLDISMPQMNGIETAAYIDKNHKLVRTLIFSMHHNEDYILKSVDSGAWGYILKDSSKEELLTAIRKIYGGEKYFTHVVSNIIVESLQNKNKKGASSKETTFKISKSEKTILKHLVNGLNSREIAEILKLSIRTVDNHRAHIMKKTGVKNTVELVKLALKENLS